MSKITSLKKLANQLAGDTGNERIILAVAGPPGSGKSTFSDALRDLINKKQPDTSEVLPMDGYHFDDTYLDPMGWLSRKGAPHTFDVGGFGAVLARLRANTEPQIAVPVFDRKLEIARAGARMINQGSKIIIVEGNYLLLVTQPWASLRRFFDATVMLHVPVKTLEARLRARWEGFGYSIAKAKEKIAGNDLPNVKEVIKNSIPADYVVNTQG